MSIELITMVRRRLDVSHGELLVAVELADAANDHGEGISVGVARIADRSRQDPRTVQRQLKRLRDVGWLQIVEEGGMRGGRGRATRYCINPAWVKGDTLPGFPDFVPQHDHREKGDNLSPIPEERVTNHPLKGDKNDVKGDTAVSPDPSTLIPSDARARAIPSGSRGAKPADHAPEFDAGLARGRWANFAAGHAARCAAVLGICRLGAERLDQLPETVNAYPFRETIRAVVVELATWAVAEEPKHWADAHLRRRDRQMIEAEIEARITRELKPFIPATRATAAA